MEWFCTEEDRSALEKRERTLTAAFRVLAAASAAAFVVLCLLVNTENAPVMHLVIIGATALLGWACIALRQLGVREARTQLGHMDMLREGEKSFREGRITLTRESVQIPKSIRIRKVLLDEGGEEPARLNLDEKWASRLPPDGSLVRLALAHSYIAGAEVLEKASGERSGSGSPAGLRKVSKLIPLLGIWAVAAVIFGSFVFYRITDTVPAHKITVYVDAPVTGGAQLAARLEKGLPDPIRMVQVRPFTYAMFGSAELKGAYLFIVPDSDKGRFEDWFSPGGEVAVVRDPQTDVSVAGAWFLYQPGETYRLYTGAGSAHLEDGLARREADLLLSLTEPEKEETP